MNNNKAILTCALTGVLTNPKQHPVPVTPEQMAAQARQAFDAGASVMHVHIRAQQEGMGHMPSWDPDVAQEVVDAIRQACPGVVINLTTGVIGKDISGPLMSLPMTPVVRLMTTPGQAWRMASTTSCATSGSQLGMWPMPSC